MLPMFLAVADQTIVATALPTIGREFQDVANLSWVITAYLLASTAVAPVFGTLCDIYGRRSMMILALSLFIAGSVLCALAPSMPILILARGLQGLGGGGIMPVVQTVISDVVSPRERGQYQAYFSGVWMLAGLLGPVIGGFFADHLHWSMIFWINLPLGLVALALCERGLSILRHQRRPARIDWAGAALVVGAVTSCLVVLSWIGAEAPLLSAAVLGLAALTLALVAALVQLRELGTIEPRPGILFFGLVVVFTMLSAMSFEPRLIWQAPPSKEKSGDARRH
jgi:MFS family permease